jgi:hypothetical protein
LHSVARSRTVASLRCDPKVRSLTSRQPSRAAVSGTGSLWEARARLRLKPTQAPLPDRNVRRFIKRIYLTTPCTALSCLRGFQFNFKRCHRRSEPIHNLGVGLDCPRFQPSLLQFAKQLLRKKIGSAVACSLDLFLDRGCKGDAGGHGARSLGV